MYLNGGSREARWSVNYQEPKKKKLPGTEKLCIERLCIGQGRTSFYLKGGGRKARWSVNCQEPRKCLLDKAKNVI